MAGIPPSQKIAQQHVPIYENYFRQVNASGSGKIPGIDAANFLKKSGLPEGTLHSIWEQADAGSKGFLDKQGFYVALKLISLAQSNQECHVKNLGLPAPPPNMGDSPKAPAATFGDKSSTWSISPKDKKQYDGIFDGLKPINGLLSGDKVKPVLLNSKLPVDILGLIWKLADIDEDGSLDRDEFSIAMFLVYRALASEAMPATLPFQLIPPSKKNKGGLLTTATAPMPAPTPQNESVFPSISAPQRNNWVVQPNEKAQYDVMFKKADTDNDGLVSGGEIKDILVASGLAQNFLAHIWNLCDINNTGQLNADQFSLAMYLINMKRMGNELPATLAPEMIPPSSRPQTNDDLSSVKFESTGMDFSAIKELDKITTEIEALGKEKSQLQREITETEEAIRNRRSEIENLQTELEQANKGLGILSNKKTESQKSLDSLHTEAEKFTTLLKEIQMKCEDERQLVQQLKNQLNSQQSSNKEQEQELAKARKELDSLKREESDLEAKIEKNRSHLEGMKAKTLAAKSEISQVQGRLEKLSEENSRIKDEINQITTADNGLPTLGDASSFDANRFKDVDQISQISARATAGSSPVSSISGFSVGSKVDDDENDPFKSKSDPFSTNTETDPFNSDDPFKSDPFKSVSFAEDPFAGDPFQTSNNVSGDNDPFTADPFKSSSSDKGSDTPASTGAGGGADPFGALDPFGGGAFSTSSTTKIDFPSTQSLGSKSDSSDPFGSTSNVFGPTSPTGDDSTVKTSPDPFASDPFAAKDPFASSGIKSDDPFASAAPIKTSTSSDDPFASSTTTNDPFASTATTSSQNASSDPFASAGTTTDLFASSKSDPFSSTTSGDPFASASTKSGDPFGSATSGSDPFAASSNDPFASTAGGTTTSDSNDAWFAFSAETSSTKETKNSSKPATNLSEDSQLEWAKKESEKEEEDRIRRMKELAQKEELEIALAIKQSVESSSDA
ncbi:epidermal growth factor receptor substrate 15-like 1 [Clytia hemisphaerica]|uniref:Epidermal growth factor receptor substrate 15-like 1 n=1 Tax=Clytia hemisphaerica TaxID=252671 RepID=A0A7M5UUZ7_9CNID